jgi:hypothetical protein
MAKLRRKKANFAVFGNLKQTDSVVRKIKTK